MCLFDPQNRDTIHSADKNSFVIIKLKTTPDDSLKSRILELDQKIQELDQVIAEKEQEMNLIVAELYGVDLPAG